MEMNKLQYTISYNRKENTWKVWKNVVRKVDKMILVLGFTSIYSGSRTSCINYLKENRLERNKLYNIPTS